MDATLLELLKEVRWKTLKLLEGVDESQARFTPEGLHNTILWHAGHALIVVEHLGFGAIPDFKPTYPADWFDKFSWSSKPATVTEEVIDALLALGYRRNEAESAATAAADHATDVEGQVRHALKQLRR